MAIKLGDKVRDRTTGIIGIVEAISKWRFGCKRIAIQPTKLKDGIPIELQWLDSKRLEIVKENGMKKSKPREGPQNDEKRSSNNP